MLIPTPLHCSTIIAFVLAHYDLLTTFDCKVCSSCSVADFLLCCALCDMEIFDLGVCCSIANFLMEVDQGLKLLDMSVSMILSGLFLQQCKCASSVSYIRVKE